MPVEFIWFFSIGAAVFAGILVFASVVKLREVRRASRWPSAAGKVITSKVEARERGGIHSKDAERMGNYPLVVYEFEVGGRRFKGKRVSIGEQMPGVDVESTLARYPLGAAVEVFYDPLDPRESVLERNVPPGFGKVIGCLVAFILIGTLGMILATSSLASKLGESFVDSDHAKLGLLMGGMGIFAALIALAQHRQLARARQWSSVAGRVTASHIERYLSTGTSGSRHSSRLFRPRVVYAYAVDGREYSNDRIAFGAQMGASVAGFLRKGKDAQTAEDAIEIVDLTNRTKDGSVPTAAIERVVRRYPIGSEVEVFYDPKNPSEAVLERKETGAWLIWLLAGGLITGSIYAFVGT